MASRNFEEYVGGLDKGVVALYGNIAINSSAAITATNGRGFTVAKTGTGQYTVTLTDKYVSLRAVHPTVVAATPVDLVPQVTSYDVASAKTIVISLLTGATATNPSAACELHFIIYLKNSTV